MAASTAGMSSDALRLRTTEAEQYCRHGAVRRRLRQRAVQMGLHAADVRKAGSVATRSRNVRAARIGPTV